MTPEAIIEQVATGIQGGAISAVPIVDSAGGAIGIVTSSDLVWLLKLLQALNNPDPAKVVRALACEIERLLSLERMSDAAAADELTCVLFGGA